MSKTQPGSLWRLRSGKSQLENLVILELTQESIARWKEELEEKRNNCKHENALRFGPTYTIRFDGSMKKTNGYYCPDCLKDSNNPIGKYKRILQVPDEEIFKRVLY